MRGFHRGTEPDGTRWSRESATIEWEQVGWRPLRVDLALRAPEGTPAEGLAVALSLHGVTLARTTVTHGRPVPLSAAIARGSGGDRLVLELQSETAGSGREARGAGVASVALVPTGVSASAGTALLLGAAAGVLLWVAMVAGRTLVLLPALVFGMLAWDARTLVDDAFINFRIVENVLAGHGPVFNVGERVEAGTSVLWLVILVAVRFCTQPLGWAVEWISLWSGIATSAGAVALLVWSARLMWTREAERPPGVGFAPAGVLVMLAVTPFKEFASSGMETGLIYLWLAGSVAAIVGIERQRLRGTRALAWMAAIVGLGPLVRPDLAVVALVFLAAIAWRALVRGWGTFVRVSLAAAALPVLGQLARAAYFAVLVPNTALAKEAFLPRWDWGWMYLTDFARPYHLGVPAAALGIAGVVTMASENRRTAVRVAALAWTAAVLHALYVIRLGGDFMHGRMLLPATLLLLAPLAVVPVAVSRAARGAPAWVNSASLVVVVGWAAWCAAWGAPPYGALVSNTGVAWEAAFYRKFTNNARPVVLEDFVDLSWVGWGRGFRARAEAGERAVVVRGMDRKVASREGLPTPFVAQVATLGLTGYAAGPAVHVVDSYGLADIVASRLRLSERGRPGHEKGMQPEWTFARFGAPAALEATYAAYPEQEPAVRATRCGDLARLIEATSAPMTPGRILANLRLAWPLTMLRFDPTPSRAVVELCR
jgi:arabinofuranosyltransferase